MEILKIKKEDLLEYDLPYFGRDEVEIMSDTIIGHGRWSVTHELIFKWIDGKFYRTNYSRAATEGQDEKPWDYHKLVECVEVELVEKLMKVWEEVK